MSPRSFRVRVIFSGWVVLVAILVAACTGYVESPTPDSTAPSQAPPVPVTTNATGVSGEMGTQANVACSAGLASCNGVCADLAADASNCGACGKACAPGRTCAAGMCTCAAGQECAGQCVDTTSSSTNCGACGRACGAGQSCVAANCACSAGLTTCGATCVNLAADNANCGACGVACAASQVCASGQCSTTCGTLSNCGGGCANTQTDALNCGACGKVCGTALSCNQGVCACQGGLTACGNGCTDTKTDAANCGACGNACSSGQTCTNGACTGGVTFDQVAAIVARTCAASSCHGGRRNPNLSNSANLRSTLMNTAVSQCGNDHFIAPSDPSNSALLELVNRKCGSFIMPQGCNTNPCIAAADIATITSWIQDGAP